MTDQYAAPRKHLKKRLMLYFSVFVAITMITITIIVAIMMTLEIKRPLDEALDHEIREITYDLEREITNVSNRVKTFSQNDLVINSLIDPQGRSHYLPAMVRNFSISEGVGSVSIVDFEGKLIFSSESEPPVSEWSPYLRTTLATGQITIFVGGSKQFFLVRPILYYQTTQGASVVASSFSELLKSILHVRDELFIEMFSSATSLFIQKPGKKKDFITKVFHAGEDTPILHQLKFSIILGISRSKFMHPMKVAVIQLLLISGVFICIAILVAARIGNGIAQPILKLCDKVSQSGMDETQTCYPVGTDDELDELALIFDYRSAELITSRREVEAANTQLREEIRQRTEADMALKKAYDDLEERIKARTNDLAKAKATAERANKAKSEFLANMSHEIRTPMNSVLGFLELTLEDSGLPESQKKNLTTAHNSAKSLLWLINDILDISKMESGRLELEKSPFDLSQMIRETASVFEVKCREKGLELAWDVEPSLSQFYIGDQGRLRQILVNLVGNAVKFTEKGSISVKVNSDIKHQTSNIEHRTSNILRFSVSDTGIGIPSEKLERIFEPFTQADNSTSRRYGGTGLGTTISRQLVSLMDGKIWVESEEGKGSEFCFTVQLEPSEPLSSDPLQTSNFELQTSRSFRILLAEDMKMNIMLAKIRLEREGHTVIEARNGREAVEAFKQEAPDIILMDIHMPEMDGLEASRNIRELEQGGETRVPIIALTASVMKQEQKEFLEAGMDAVAGKPVDFEELFHIMENLVPQGKGRTVADGHKTADHNTPLLSRLKGIDAEKGLRIWQDPDAYKNALVMFSRDYADSADEILRLVENGKREEAYQTVHKLKGVAGNLSIIQVYAAAEKLSSEIRQGQKAELIPLIRTLGEDLNDAAVSIRETEPEETEDEQQEEAYDLPVLKEIFREMTDSFEQLNPGAAAPFLEKLEAMLSPDRLEPIKQRLERFDFKGARAEAEKLAGDMGIDA